MVWHQRDVVPELNGSRSATLAQGKLLPCLTGVVVCPDGTLRPLFGRVRTGQACMPCMEITSVVSFF